MYVNQLKNTAMSESNDKKIIGYEPVFAVHCPNPDDPANDLHTIKVIRHYSDGTVDRVLSKKFGFKRPFYVTSPKYQDYQEKKTYERVSRLNKFECTQTELPMAVARQLGVRTARPNLRKLGNSPYLYCTDLLSTTLLMYKLKEKYKDILPAKKTIAVLDSEWSMVDGVLTIVTVTMKDQWFIAVNKRMIKDYANPTERFHDACERYISKDIKSRGVDRPENIHFFICDTEWDMLCRASEQLHKLQPDFVGIWNIRGDIKKFQEVADRHGKDLGTIFSDPTIPSEFKYFRFKEGRDTHVAKSTRSMTLTPDKQWHTVYCPSSFYFVCMMATYSFVRKGQAKVKMSLDACLYRHLKKTKFKFPPADNSSEHWHIVMERDHPFVYMCYALLDCVGPEELEEKTNDVTISMPVLAGYSDLSNFSSNPKLLVDDVTFEFAKQGLIISSSPDERYDPFKGRTVDQRCNIVTLDTSIRVRNGYACIEEMSNFATNIYLFTLDSDITTAYPGNQSIFNLCMESTYRELLFISGLPEQVKREVFINLSSSARNNALEITQTVMGAPNLYDMLDTFKKEHNMI